ncbi:hypothetical protein FY557_19850 [Chryseobacterium sp. SN22]|nr:hypothetical protein FY557_19850 [Chryseobacterium sp. SN22]
MKHLLFCLMLLLSTKIYSQTIDASDFTVDNVDIAGHRMDFSFNITGTFFKMDMRVYKNSEAPSNLISFNSKVDESNYEQFTFPAGTRYSTYSTNYYLNYIPTKLILVISTWENQGSPKIAKTLTYYPPVTPLPTNLKIDGFKITESSNNNKVIFDSYNASQYPSPNPKVVQSTKNYNFKVFIRKEGNAALNDVNVDFLQYDTFWGTYPNTSPSSPKNLKVNFEQDENLKSVDFFSNVTNFSSSTIGWGLVFHVDRNNNISETNETDNYLGVHGIAYPAGTTLRLANSDYSQDYTEVMVFNEKGKHIKTFSAPADDKNFSEIKKQLSVGSYIFKINNSTKRIKIYR